MTSSKTVLHINVRLERGGAAQVARTLSTEMQVLGYEGRLAYGYGPRAGDSPDQASTGAIRITSRPRALVNAGVHAVIGEEALDAGRDRAARLTAAAEDSDLVHLHAIHSYMGPPRLLVATLGGHRRSADLDPARLLATHGQMCTPRWL